MHDALTHVHPLDRFSVIGCPGQSLSLFFAARRHAEFLDSLLEIKLAAPVFGA